MVAVIRPEVDIRRMERSDLAEVFTIEQASYPFPWTRGILTDCLRVGYRCRVLTVDREIASYAIVSHAMEEAHLLNLCVAETFRRRGFARTMLLHLIDEVRTVGIARMFLEVRPSNPGAVELYRSLGFRKIGRRPGYYPAEHGREDALVMVRHLDYARAGEFD
jgi:ribosomal-protein-alanine N-acetyltransferase